MGLSWIMDKDNSKETRGSWQDISTWASHLAENSSLHGVGWYTKTQNNVARSIIFGLSIIVVITLPTMLCVKYVEFLNDTSISNAVEWVTPENLTYPNITVCHPGYFDKKKMEAYGVDDNMANYMTMALDPTIGAYVDFSTHVDSATKAILGPMLVVYKAKLETLLSTENMTLVQLFKALAIDCDDFFIYCDIHRTMYFTANANDKYIKEHCCGTFFDKEPIFSYMGTCFRSSGSVIENDPSVFSSIRLMLYMLPLNGTPDYSIFWKGTDATERTGATFAFSGIDHPASILIRKGHRMATGMLSVVGLEKFEFDQTRLKSRECIQEGDQVFKEKYGMENTKANCKLAQKLNLVPNCTHARFKGLKDHRNVPDCMPHQVIEASRSDSRLFTKINKCPNDCVHTEYKAQSTWTEVKKSPIMTFFQAMPPETWTMPYDATRISIVQLYYRSLDYSRFIQYQDSLSDFLSRVGGWMGLAVGASIFSFLEILAFLFIFGRIILKRIFKI